MWMICFLLGLTSITLGIVLTTSGYKQRQITLPEHRQGVGTSRLAIGIVLMAVPPALLVLAMAFWILMASALATV